MSALAILYELMLVLYFLFAYMAERLEQSAHPPPDKDGDYRLPMHRDRRAEIGKGYDPVAEEVLHRLEERRRQRNLDNGLRRRRSDRDKA